MIEVEHLSRSYGSTQALHDVSFVAPAGKVTGFVGPNGAGKSTVMRIAAGLCRPDSGSVRINGASFPRSSRPASAMGVFLSAEWIAPSATARGVLEYACDSQGLPSARARQALDLVGLSDVGGARVGTFSLGMRQRLGIAAATLGRPGVLLLDEPVNGLDPDGIRWFRTFLQSQAEAGATVLLSSHHMAELALTADQVVMIDRGRIVAQGPLGDLVAETAPSVYATSPDVDAVCQALGAAGYQVERSGEGFTVLDADPLEIGRIAFAIGVGLTHLEQGSQSLEEMYFDRISSGVGKGKS